MSLAATRPNREASHSGSHTENFSGGGFVSILPCCLAAGAGVWQQRVRTGTSQNKALSCSLSLRMRTLPHISYLCLFVFVWHFCLPALFKWWGAGLGWFMSMPNKSQQPAVYAAHLINLLRVPIKLFLKPVSSLIALLCGYPTLALGLLPFVSFFPLFVACHFFA